MGWFPERWRVSHEARLEGGLDEMNEPVEGFSEPVEVPVFGWATPGADGVLRPLDTGVKRDLDLYCAMPFAGPGDLVTVPGEPLKFTVEGYPEDYNHGPFGFMPGYRINLVRVEG